LVGFLVQRSSTGESAAHGTFSQTGSLQTDRWLATATLLDDGRVLIAGGHNESGQLASAELYDPRTGAFYTTGSMDLARAGHTATLLQDGRVLIAGGSPDGEGSASAELYDPRAGTFSPVAAMAANRENASAMRLPDGRVLVAGGANLDGGDRHSLSSAEIFDPTTLTWSPTGLLGTARESAGATLLQNGTVLVYGGSQAVVNGPWTYLDSAEVYDPQPGTFTTLDLKTWGCGTPLKDGRILFAGGSDGTNFVSSAELYDPKAGAVNLTGEPPASGMCGGVLLQNGSVLFEGWNPTRSVPFAELYDPSTGVFSPTGLPLVVRIGPAVAQLKDGRVLVVGGAKSDGSDHYVASAELYTP
jgi:hypothetical protein